MWNLQPIGTQESVEIEMHSTRRPTLREIYFAKYRGHWDTNSQVWKANNANTLRGQHMGKILFVDANSCCYFQPLVIGQMLCNADNNFIFKQCWSTFLGNAKVSCSEEGLGRRVYFDASSCSPLNLVPSAHLSFSFLSFWFSCNTASILRSHSHFSTTPIPSNKNNTLGITSFEHEFKSISASLEDKVVHG